jgi:hypothetical protein
MLRAALQKVAPERDAHEDDDPTFYPTEEKVGQDTLQMFILELLRPLVERWLALCGKPTFVGEDQFIYYERGKPKKVVAPDLYVLPRVQPGRRFQSWKVWQTGIVPSFALEVVSAAEPKKDDEEVVERYATLGVGELIIFDPDHEQGRERVRWQRYRKLKRRGFVKVESSNADRLRSQVLGCFLRVVGSGDAARVRLGTGPAGDELVPTATEAERAAKKKARAAKKKALAAKKKALAEKEAERAEKEAERAEKEAERAEKEQALARVAELEALVAKLGRQGAR